METRPITPLTLQLIDGTERRFILSMGDLNRIMTRFKCASPKELFALGDMKVAVPILYAGLLDKGEMTEDGLCDLLPAHLPVLGQAVATLLGISFPDPKPADPTGPTPAIQ